MKRTIISLLTVITFLCAYAQSETQNTENNNKSESENDVKTTTLQELVVTSDYAWVDGEKFVFVPRKNEKNLATDAISLVQNMHIPVLYVDKGNIKSRTGGDVSIFINGVPADDMDLSTFWPKNALRVEFMESSPDPKFEGKHNILNFIMKEYELGGLTKVRGRQTLPNDGRYEASSKFVYKKMTYNAMFKGGYSRDHRSGSYSRESYNDVWYDGNFYDRIDRIEDSDNNATRNDNIYAGLNARYRTTKANITHKVMLKWDRNPESYQNGEAFYSPKLFDGNKMHSLTRSRSLSPALGGNYGFGLNQKWSLGISWNFNHSHNNSFSGYQEGDASEIVNRFKENSYAYGMNIGLSYMLRQNMAFQLVLKESRNIYTSYYSGYTDSHQWQHYGETFASLMWWYRVSNKVSFNLTPQIIIKDRNTNHIFKETQFLPGVQLNSYYRINNKNSLSFYLFYFENTPNANATNDLILRQSELTWLKGNPIIKSSDTFNFHLSYFSAPTQYLDMYASASWNFGRNEQMLQYFPGGKKYDGVILQYANAGHKGSVHCQYDINVRLLKNKLVLHGDISYDYTYFTGSLHKSKAYFRPRANVYWYFGNCCLGAGYLGKEKIISNGGTEVYTYPDQVWASFSYGNGNFNVDVNLTQPFKNHLIQNYWVNNGPYSSQSQKWSNARNVSVSLTYTFDYGKKIDPGIDIYEENIRNSSKL